MDNKLILPNLKHIKVIHTIFHLIVNSFLSVLIQQHVNNFFHATTQKNSFVSDAERDRGDRDS